MIIAQYHSQALDIDIIHRPLEDITAKIQNSFLTKILLCVTNLKVNWLLLSPHHIFPSNFLFFCFICIVAWQITANLIAENCTWTISVIVGQKSERSLAGSSAQAPANLQLGSQPGFILFWSPLWGKIHFHVLLG